MPDHSEQGRSFPSSQVGSRHFGLDLGEHIYARNAQFVWQKSIASSLAGRYTPFSDRLPLATAVQRHWAVSNSPRFRSADLHWLLTFAPRRRRHSASEPRMADNMVARSFDPAAVSSSTPEVAHAAPEAVQLTTIAQSSNISQASVIPNIDRIVQEQPQAILGFSKVSRQIDNVTPSETSRGFQNNSGANATRISHGDNTLTSHLSRSVTVYNGPPIMRRNLASRGADIARADSNKRKSFELSGSLLETTLQRTHQESPIAPLITSDPKSGFSGGGSSRLRITRDQWCNRRFLM